MSNENNGKVRSVWGEGFGWFDPLGANAEQVPEDWTPEANESFQNALYEMLFPEGEELKGDRLYVSYNGVEVTDPEKLVEIKKVVLGGGDGA